MKNDKYSLVELVKYCPFCGKTEKDSRITTHQHFSEVIGKYIVIRLVWSE